MNPTDFLLLCRRFDRLIAVLSILFRQTPVLFSLTRKCVKDLSRITEAVIFPETDRGRREHDLTLHTSKLKSLPTGN